VALGFVRCGSFGVWAGLRALFLFCIVGAIVRLGGGFPFRFARMGLRLVPAWCARFLVVREVRLGFAGGVGGIA